MRYLINFIWAKGEVPAQERNFMRLTKMVSEDYESVSVYLREELNRLGIPIIEERPYQHELEIEANELLVQEVRNFRIPHQLQSASGFLLKEFSVRITSLP